MIVLIDFVDLQDNKHLYHAGDNFPRNGKDVSKDRIEELSGSANALGRPIIGEKASVDVSDEVKEYVPKKRGRKRAD